ncbi:beta-N-acetylhexosaminidase [Gramella sp. KN1008]|uniref:beta-N-acetylhexosaminidase n=1 Tax=Gramella sp. KN1008 TaxID=2529298 RepID=UPI00103E305C|nr:beta-N-acetylhexosaminidase [Gramella sp. KN1008]TBW28633.1 glycoside hydrolase family 20 [Gramella sp. KN1008]
MKFSHFIILIIAVNFNSAFAQENVQIIPQPSQIEYGQGSFSLEKGVNIIAPQALENEAEFLADILGKGLGIKPEILPEGKGIEMEIEPDLHKHLGKEGYVLEVGLSGISINAATSSGVFYGIQSLRQLLPSAFEFTQQKEKIEIPILTVTDVPRFPWRAFMLDESRHFKGSREVKKLLDQMALLKMNTFHWHLTDDQGWRIEIKKYPRLTEIGSKRKDTQASRKSEKRTGEPHEGFYTQEQIKEIIDYAKLRHITIVPEIEMPGHAMAAVAAYPWLGSLGTTTEVPVVFGKMDDSFNIADPNVVQFLKDVLDEVFALFPGNVVHIGGDEVNFKAWEESESAQRFMKQNDLESEVDLQIFFTNQMSNYIDKAGKRMMGWNEILGDDIHEERQQDPELIKQKLAKSAIVHFWKGDLNLINRAVQEGYDVVNSNHWDTYLDYTYERTPLSKSYAFDPVPDGLESKYHSRILGTGTQMWSEWIPSVAEMERQIFPRLAAYAEVGWTPVKKKNFERFQASLEKLQQRWTLQGINFYKETDDTK